jgi:Flp pilus assembly protein TadG
MIGTRRGKVGSRAWRKGSRGQAQVEFVLTILFVLLLIFGIIELIMLIYTYNVLADSAKEGVRYAIVHGCDFDSSTCSGTCAFAALPPQNACTDANADNVKAWARNFARASLHDTSAMAIAVNYPDGSSDAPNRVQVAVSYPYQPLFGLGWPTVTVRAAAEGRIVY